MGNMIDLDFGDLLLKGARDPMGIWQPHESPLIRGLVEKWTNVGIHKFGALQSELVKWIDHGQHKPGPQTASPEIPWGRWTPGEVKTVKLYLESLPPEAFTVDDWLLVVNYLFQRYLPQDVMLTDAEMLAVRSSIMGKVAANVESLSEGKASKIADAAPFQVAAANRLFPGMTTAQRAALAFGKARCCELVVQLSENARMDMRKLIIDWQAQVALGGDKAPREALQSRLLDKFGMINRDWRRIAITEAGENMNQGMIASLPVGTVVKRIEQYSGACSFCKKWDGANLTVVSPEKANKNPDTEVWVGKTNVGRSSSPMKQSGTGLVPRTTDELWQPTAGLFHPHCRGRWLVVSSPTDPVNLPDEQYLSWLRGQLAKD